MLKKELGTLDISAPTHDPADACCFLPGHRSVTSVDPSIIELFSHRDSIFIIGAPRCGTTSLYEWLRCEPGFCAASRKESHHLAHDLLEAADYYATPSHYVSLFEHASPNDVLVESSVFYLYSRAARETIASFPRARVIVLLRNPLELLVSYHNRLLWKGDETISNLTAAIAAEPVRRQGRSLPSGVRFPQKLYYSSIIQPSWGIAEYQRRLGRSRVHVVLLSELYGPDEQATRDTFVFLGRSEGRHMPFAKANSAKAVRSLWLRDSLRSADSLLYRAIQSLPRSYYRRKCRQALLALNSRSAALEMCPRLPAHTASVLIAEVRRLSGLLDRDLSKWEASIRATTSEEP